MLSKIFISFLEVSLSFPYPPLLILSLKEVMSDLVQNIISHLSLELLAEITHQRGTTVVKVKDDDGLVRALKVAEMDCTTADVLYNPTIVLKQEIKVLQALANPLYVSSGHYNGAPWLTTHWVEGRSAKDHLLELLAVTSGPKERKAIALELFISLTEVVEELHSQGFTHGDLQSNHFRCSFGKKPVLIDFGLARHSSDHSFNYEGALVFFNAPEVSKRKLEGRRDRVLDLISEIYSLGAVLFFVYTGKPLVKYIEGEDINGAIARGDKVTFDDAGATAFPELEEILSRMTKLDRRERYSSLREVLFDLKKLHASLV